MGSLRNTSGLPLSGSEWLAAHHTAKLPERRAFAASLARLNPKRVVDLGCASGLWLELLNESLPVDCEFVGLDCDPSILEEARHRARTWARTVRFELTDLNDADAEIPDGDLVLLFNICGYIHDLPGLLARLYESNAESTLVIRQYDGAMLRFGPMPNESRATIEASLRAAVSNSTQLRHYDMDRVVEAVASSGYETREVRFELFERTAPFGDAFAPYLDGTLNWTENLISDDAKALLSQWRRTRLESSGYFVEVDYVAMLS